MYALPHRLIRNLADRGELINMRAALVDIQRNIDKADRTDDRVQHLASCINIESLRKAYRSMDGRRAVGIDKVAKAEYSKELDLKLSDLDARMKGENKIVPRRNRCKEDRLSASG